MNVLGLGLFDRICKLGLMDLLDPEKKFDGFFFNTVRHLIEHVKSLALVFHKRIALAISAQRSTQLKKLLARWGVVVEKGMGTLAVMLAGETMVLRLVKVAAFAIT